MDLRNKIKKLCIDGDIETITEMISKGLISNSTNQNFTCNIMTWALYGACYGGHIKLINLLIENGADNWDYGLAGACRGGHYNVMYMMVSRGASNFILALKGASASGNIDIVNMILDSNRVDINYALCGACATNKKQIIELAIQRGANDWNGGMATACENGYLDLVKSMIERGATEWNMGMNNACRYGHLDAVRLMIDMGANNFNHGLINACMWNKIETVKLMISLGGNAWDKALERAYNYYMNFGIIKLLLDSSRGGIKAQDLVSLRDSEDVKLYSLYCKYNVGGSIDPRKDAKFKRLLLKYPPYIVLLGKITKNKQCCVSKLPYELHRLLHECFYNL